MNIHHDNAAAPLAIEDEDGLHFADGAEWSPAEIEAHDYTEARIRAYYRAHCHEAKRAAQAPGPLPDDIDYNDPPY